MSGSLGRIKPPNRDHIAAYPLRALIVDPTSEFVIPPKGSEVGLGLPSWWAEWDQGSEGACVGYGTSAMMSVTNSRQVWRATHTNEVFRYAPRWLYFEAQKVDPWPGGAYPGAEEFYEGTTVSAACSVLKSQGHCRVVDGVDGECDPAQGISAYRWAVTVDQMRAAIFAQCAVSIGIDWYENFDEPVTYNGEQWIGRSDNLGDIRGGHCVNVYRYSDSRKAFKFMNSWGDVYEPTWIPYEVMQQLLNDDGEAAVITDR